MTLVLENPTRCPQLATVFVALGSNLDNPLGQLKMAWEALKLHSPPDSTIPISKVYFSAPMGPKNQNGYYNAVCQAVTGLSPLDYLKCLQSIEAHQGRKRDIRWGPRTIDLDLLLYDDLCIEGSLLTLPHPGIKERWFVLKPLSDLAPMLRIPGEDSLVSTLLNTYPRTAMATTV